MPNQVVKNGLKTKMIKLPQIIFFLKNQLIKVLCTYSPLSFCKILKNVLEPIQSYEDVPIYGPKCLLPWTIFWGVQIIIITFIYLLALFIVTNLKKIFSAELWECPIFGPKMVHLPQTTFFLEND